MGFMDLLCQIGKAVMPAPLKLVASVISFSLPGSYYKDVKPILHTLRILGRLPVYITVNGLEKCSFLSWPWIYSILSLTVQVITTLMGFTYIIKSMNQSSDYDEYLFWLMLCLILVLNLLVPCTFWCDACSLSDYLKQWTQFQNEFFTVSKGPLGKIEFLEGDIKSGSKNYIFWMSVINIPFVLTVTCVEVIFFVEMPYIVIFPYVVIFGSIYSCSLYWCSACKQLVRISEILLDKTVQAIMNDKTKEIVWCRRCWVRVSGLTSGLGSSMKNSALVNVVVMSVSFVICMYACLSVITRQLTSQYLVGILTEIPITLTVLILIFNHSNNATVKVGTQFGSTLLSLDLSHLSVASTAEVNFFLHSLSLSPPIVKLADYVDVNRRLLTSFASNVITYLIVLLQFRDTGSRVIHNYTHSLNHTTSTLLSHQ